MGARGRIFGVGVDDSHRKAVGADSHMVVGYFDCTFIVFKNNYQNLLRILRTISRFQTTIKIPPKNKSLFICFYSSYLDSK